MSEETKPVEWKPVTFEVTETLRQLHQARTELATLTAELKQSLEAHIQVWMDDHQAQEERKIALRDQVGRLENAARSLAVAAYKLTGSKSPYPGLKVQVKAHIAYDRAKAFQWAKEHNLCLQLDTRAMDDQVRAMIKQDEYPDWITTEKTPVGTIAKDLSKVLEDA